VGHFLSASNARPRAHTQNKKAHALRVQFLCSVYILNSSQTSTNNKTTDQPKVITPKEATDAKTMDAVKLMNGDVAKAKTLLQEARKKYVELGDTNGVVNVDSQLYLIEHPTPKK